MSDDDLMDEIDLVVEIDRLKAELAASEQANQQLRLSVGNLEAKVKGLVEAWLRLCARENANVDAIPNPERVPGKLADCNVAMKTIAHTADLDLDKQTHAQMETNRRRKWLKTSEGCGQHTE